MGPEGVCIWLFWFVEEVAMGCLRRRGLLPALVLFFLIIPGSFTTPEAGDIPHFVFGLGPTTGIGFMTYTQTSISTGRIDLNTNAVSQAQYYSITLVGTTGLTFPLVATITATLNNAIFILVREDTLFGAPETVRFPNSATLTRQVPPDGNSDGAGVSVPDISAGNPGPQGTIIITAPGVQTLTITINFGGFPADTTTTLTSSPNPSVFGQSVTFTATVSPVPPATGTPTGTAWFFDGAT
jgi:hypothetical protein